MKEVIRDFGERVFEEFIKDWCRRYDICYETMDEEVRA